MSVIKDAIQHPALIDYLLGANNYTWIYFRDGQKKLLAKPISFLEKELPDFVRIHKTALINPASILRVEQPPRKKMAGTVYLESGISLPVSRRRWTQLMTTLPQLVLSALPAATPGNASDLSLRTAVPDCDTSLTISLITDDKQHTLAINRLMEEKWPFISVYSTHQAGYLPDFLSDLPVRDYPAFILMDARTSTYERLAVLERLKQHRNLCQIPVIVFVPQSDEAIADGYRQYANSVISMPPGYSKFIQTVERVCHFWLRAAALPMDADYLPG